MIKKWIEKIFGKFCKCKAKTTSELLKKDFNEEQEAFKLEKVISNVCDKHPKSYKKTCPSCREAK